MKKRIGIGLLEGTRLLAVSRCASGLAVVSRVHNSAGSLIKEHDTLSDR
jgi:hypothetical protein